jgi:hypothetical protein
MSQPLLLPAHPFRPRLLGAKSPRPTLALRLSATAGEHNPEAIRHKIKRPSTAEEITEFAES